MKEFLLADSHMLVMYCGLLMIVRVYVCQEEKDMQRRKLASNLVSKQHPDTVSSTGNRPVVGHLTFYRHLNMNHYINELTVILCT